VSIDQVHEVFRKWSKADLSSYLIDVTVAFLGRRYEKIGWPLIDIIVDVVEQKRTGRWPSQEALELGVPMPSITAATEARSPRHQENCESKPSECWAVPSLLAVTVATRRMRSNGRCSPGWSQPMRNVWHD
jgi:6-phosphogluconate dehydrogenase